MIVIVGGILVILLLLIYMVGAMYATLGLLYTGSRKTGIAVFSSGIVAFLAAMGVTALITS